MGVHRSRGDGSLTATRCSYWYTGGGVHTVGELHTGRAIGAYAVLFLCYNC